MRTTWVVNVPPEQRIADALRQWWKDLRIRDGPGSYVPIPWTSIFLYEARQGARSSTLNIEACQWRERAPDYEFVMVYERIDGDTNQVNVIGIRSITCADPATDIFPVSRRSTGVGTHDAFVQCNTVYSYYDFSSPKFKAPPSDHIYPLIGNWRELCEAHRHLWALDPASFELRPDVAGSKEQLWLGRLLIVYEKTAIYILDDAQHMTLSDALPKQMTVPDTDYKKYADAVCRLVGAYYFIEPLPADAPHRLAEWKARMYAQQWVNSIKDAGFYTLMMRVQRVVLYCILSYGWRREAHVASLIRNGQLPFEACRALDVDDIGSAVSTWWHYSVCDNISWSAEIARRVAATSEVDGQARTPTPVPHNKRVVLDTGWEKKQGFMSVDAAAGHPIDSAYEALASSNMPLTPVPTGSCFATTPFFSVARCAYLLQPRTHCLMWASNVFHILETSVASELFMRDVSDSRGQVFVDGLPSVFCLLLKPGSSVAVHESPLAIARFLHNKISAEIGLDAAVETLPLLVPASISNSSHAQLAGARWILLYQDIVVRSANDLCDLIKRLGALVWNGVPLDLFAPHAAGTVWPLDPGLARLHPAPSAALVTRTLERHGVDQYVGDPVARPIPMRSHPGQPASAHRGPATLEQPKYPRKTTTLTYGDGDSWCYSAPKLLEAVLNYLSEFHKEKLCRYYAPPSCVYLVPADVLRKHDPYVLQTHFNAPHALLFYTDVHRWIVALHMEHCAQIRNQPPISRKTPLGAAREYACRAFREPTVRIQIKFNQIHAMHMPPVTAGRGAPTSAMNGIRALEDSLTDNFAQAYLTTVFGRDPSSVRGEGTQLVFGDQGSRSFCIAGKKRGLWYDFRSNTGGRGLLRLAAHEMFGDANLTRKAYDHALTWLSEANPAELAKMQLPSADAGANARSVPGLTPEQMSTIFASAHTVQDEPFLLRYLVESRGLGTLPGVLLRYWNESQALRATASASYYIAQGVPRVECSALLVPMHDRNGVCCKLQTLYLSAHDRGRNGPIPAPGKLSLEHHGVRMPSKKTRNVGDTPSTDAFAALYLTPTASGPILLAEGVETALSAWLAFPGANVFSSAGIANWRHFNRTDALQTRLVVLCRDNDTGIGAENTQRATDNAVRELTALGYDVRQIRPHRDYGDFNDVHRAMPGELGTNTIREMVIPQLPELASYVGGSSTPPAEDDDDDLIRLLDDTVAAAPRTSVKRTINDDDDDDTLARLLDETVAANKADVVDFSEYI